MTAKELILKQPKLKALFDSPKFLSLPKDRQDYMVDLIEDALFWIDLDDKPHSSDGFKFLAATYGLQKAQSEAHEKDLQGRELEKFIRPHQDLYTMFNPYSGNANESKKK
ncbi:MAG: hypothetical protein HYT76_02340 [Deltaproteobacteria bacterium]|nr:hypothetical protein [Deltaproteobacteria bacterium]